jgi:uncharacterized phage protein (TIGR02220 family)
MGISKGIASVPRKCFSGTPLNECSFGAEMLYSRLLVMSDDNRNYWALPERVASDLLKKRFERGQVTVDMVSGWLEELKGAGLLTEYTHRNTVYINLAGVDCGDGSDIRFPGCGVHENDTRAELVDKANAVLCCIESAASSLGYDKVKFPRTDSHREQIIGRLVTDKHTVDELCLVAQYKCATWLNDDKMYKYVRPVTLFAPKKFAGYLNEAIRWDKKGRPAQRRDGSLYRGVATKDNYGAVVK